MARKLGADASASFHEEINVMVKNIFAFIGLWVVVATTQELIRKFHQLAESEAN